MGVRAVERRSGRRAANDAGFTLLELLAVLAVLAILAVLIGRGYSGYVRETANARVEAELEMVGKAVRIANAGSGGITRILVGPDGTLSVEGELDEDFCEDFRQWYLTCRVEYIADYKILGDGKKEEYYITSIIITCFTQLAAGSDYENGAVWTPDKGWMAAE